MTSRRFKYVEGRNRKVYALLFRSITQGEGVPSYRDIRIACGISSYSLQKTIKQLIQRGWIEHKNNTARSIRLLPHVYLDEQGHIVEIISHE